MSVDILMCSDILICLNIKVSVYIDMPGNVKCLDILGYLNTFEPKYINGPR